MMSGDLDWRHGGSIGMGPVVNGWVFDVVVIVVVGAVVGFGNGHEGARDSEVEGGAGNVSVDCRT